MVLVSRNAMALSFCETGRQYLNLADAAANEIFLQGNPCGLVSDEPISPERFAEETKWADHNLCLPILFNFYHGIEVLMKGILRFKSIVNNTHESRSEFVIYQTLHKFKLVKGNRTTSEPMQV